MKKRHHHPTGSTTGWQQIYHDFCFAWCSLLLVVLVVLGSTTSTSVGSAVVVGEALKYNEIQQKNSHNSYERTEGLLDQMIYHHCRTVEIDAHLGFAAGLFDGTSCIIYIYVVIHTTFLYTFTDPRSSSCQLEVFLTFFCVSGIGTRFLLTFYPSSFWLRFVLFTVHNCVVPSKKNIKYIMMLDIFNRILVLLG